MIHEWERQYPGRIDNMFTAMTNVKLSHLADRKLYPFETVKATGTPDRDGDKAFDDDEDCGTGASPVNAGGVQTVQWHLDRTDLDRD